MKTMSTERTEQTFQALEEFIHKGEDKTGLSDEELALMGRYGEIIYMLERDGIWPLTASPERNRFCAALREVLCRLPQEAFDRVDSGVRFLLDDPSLKMLAINAPAPPNQGQSGRPGIDTIVFFRSCMDLTPKAMMGVIAREIAHSFVCGKDYSEDHVLAESKALAWGFAAEVDCLKSEAATKPRPANGYQKIDRVKNGSSGQAPA